MKQTVVEWLEHQIREYNNLLIKKEWQAIFERAKEMEKEQILDAYKADLYPCSDEDAEDYYNQTFKSE